MWTLASDIDGTLTGDRDALNRLTSRLHQLRDEGKLFLILSTGRRLDQVLGGIQEEGLPEPDAVICQVGTEIYLAPFSTDSHPMSIWREQLLAEYSREQALAFVQGIEGLLMQPDMFNTELKTSCFLNTCPDPEAAATAIRERTLPHADRYQVVWSSGRDLDILPASSGKGKAIRFLIEQQRLDSRDVVVAGDTGNDAAMFKEFSQCIAVANARQELLDMVRSLDERCTYLAKQCYAAGVEEGLEHFGVLSKPHS